jgi:hypothetical protein
MYAYGTLKPVEVIFKKGNGVGGRILVGMNQTGLSYMYLWKCHNETPCITTIY